MGDGHLWQHITHKHYLLYLSKSFQNPRNYNRSEVPGVRNNGRQQRQDRRPEDPEQKEELSPKPLSEHSSRNLRYYVTVEEGRQYDALLLRIPVIVARLKTMIL